MSHGHEYSLSERDLLKEQLAEFANAFVVKTYGWMALGLLITALVSLYTIASGLWMTLVASKGLIWGLLIAELAIVIGISWLLPRISAVTAIGLFIAYAALNGLTFAVIVLAYTAESVAVTFGVTAGMFAIMTVYGMTTRRDLTSVGNLLFMALIGLILGTIVNMFWASSTLYWAMTYLGVVIFVGLTAYDAQKIRQIGLQGFDSAADDGETETKASIMGALALYLDFINLFLLLLRVLGNRR